MQVHKLVSFCFLFKDKIGWQLFLQEVCFLCLLLLPDTLLTNVVATKFYKVKMRAGNFVIK